MIIFGIINISQPIFLFRVMQSMNILWQLKVKLRAEHFRESYNRLSRVQWNAKCQHCQITRKIPSMCRILWRTRIHKQFLFEQYFVYVCKTTKCVCVCLLGTHKTGNILWVLRKTCRPKCKIRYGEIEISLLPDTKICSSAAIRIVVDRKSAKCSEIELDCCISELGDAACSIHRRIRRMMDAHANHCKDVTVFAGDTHDASRKQLLMTQTRAFR